MNESPNVPDHILDDEKLVRLIFSPFHLNKAGDKLQPNAFRPPYERDEVSVTRLKFTDAHFCKQQGLEMSNEAKTFQGLAVLNHQEVTSIGAGAKVSKLPENPFHADLYFGIVSKRGEALPAELNEKMKALAEMARYYQDRNPQSRFWESGVLD